MSSVSLTSAMAREGNPSQADSSGVSFGATSPTSSTGSSASTINAAGENTNIRDQESQNDLSNDPASSLSTSPIFDWRSRSVSAPASRSSSFAKNLDQLAFLNQSAHRFPVTLPSVPSSNGSHGTENTERGGPSPQNNMSSPTVNPQPIASSSRARTIASRSTPTSPHLSPALSSASAFSRSAGNPSLMSEGIPTRQTFADSRHSPAARARAALFSPGSGFTPAHDQSMTRPQNPTQRARTSAAESSNEATHSDHVTPSNGRARRQRARSTSATEAVNDQAEGRSRASSASAGSTSSPHTRPQRARAQSARTSPTLTSTHLSPNTASYNPNLQISTAFDQGPHRTNSVPHFAQYSPVIYSYGYRHCDSQGGLAPTATAFVPATPADLSTIGGYFALPPAMSAFPDPMSLSPREADESPPPYTPSETNLRAMNVQMHPQNAAMITNRSEHSSALSRSASGRRQPAAQRPVQDPEDEEEDDNALSFSTNARRNRSMHQGASQLATSTSNARSGQPVSVRSDDETETEVERGPESPSMRSNESLSSPVARHRVLEGEPLAKEEWNYIERLERPSKLRQFVLMYLVLPLRLLATVPGLIGTFWLMRNAFVVGWSSSMLWRKPIEGMQAQPSSLEFALSALYSMTTAYHAYSFTTLLLRRWLHYYSLLPSLIRLIALQALCWPLVRLTLYTMGPRNPLPAWIVISTTTACSDTIARWVVSNITDESDGLSNAAMGIGEGTGANGDLSAYNKGRYGRYGSGSRIGRSSIRSQSSTIRTKSRGGIGMAFWRAIMGAPPRQRSGRLSATLAAAEHGRPHGLVTESEAESDAESFMSPTLSRTRYINTSSSSINATRRLAELRRRRNGGEALSPQMDPASEGLTSAGEGEEDDELGDLPSTLDRTLAANAQHKNIERVGRIFHWDVAIRRNVLPIGILAYMTMWVLLIEDVRLRL
ncbi:uncharacterized protein FA14DRAFT_178451 [Meira miltonrushii]|uniref:N-glycosylation protein EOS1 n=1 Tax=Meira miltonrushii TaxID=1280837 RepID=A0A316VC68_9BASI|nr:uncharacterized protein FA14DRAFT_178451 [Meira miltonrushii]PWN35070.1 hypothetical protein FA14DRAFT_178451 [Meira miltonrushii]